MNKDSTLYTLHSTPAKPILLISASDSSAAAGMQVDLRVLSNLGVPARCAVTAITIQGDEGARRINPVEPDLLVDAINTAMTDSPGIGAVKVGLLGDKRTADALGNSLSILKTLGIPVVVDPVMRSTSGSTLSNMDTADTLLEKVLPWTSLLTPNRDELAKLCSLAGKEDGDEAAKAIKLLESGAGGILVTGGDTNEDQCLDILYVPGSDTKVFKHPRIGAKVPRGTGCALSTAIAVHLSRGIPMEEAVGWSIDYVTGLIEQAVIVGNQLLLLPGGK